MYSSIALTPAQLASSDLCVGDSVLVPASEDHFGWGYPLAPAFFADVVAASAEDVTSQDHFGWVRGVYGGGSCSYSVDAARVAEAVIISDALSP